MLKLSASNPPFLAILDVWEYISIKANNGHWPCPSLGVQHPIEQTSVNHAYVLHILQLSGWAMPLPGVAMLGSGAACLHILGILGPKGLLTSRLDLWVIVLSFMRIFIYVLWQLRGMKGDNSLKGWKKNPSMWWTLLTLVTSMNFFCPHSVYIHERHWEGGMCKLV